MPVSSASLLFQAKYQPYSFCSKHAWILSGKENSLSLSLIYLHPSCLSSSFHALQITWKWDGRGELSCSGNTWTGSSTWHTLNWVPKGAHLKSEGKLLTKHHSRWARVYSIGGQDLQVPVCKSSCWNLKTGASLCLGRKDLSRGQIYYWQQCQNHPVLLHLSKIPCLDDGFMQIIWSRMGQHPFSIIIYP